MLAAAFVAMQSAPVYAACPAPSTAGVNVCSPMNASSDVNPVHYIAAASTTCSAGVANMSIFSTAGVKVYSVAGSTLDTFLPLRPGGYNTIVQETDKCGGSSQQNVAIVVVGTAVLTYQYDVRRTGANSFETTLTTANVNSTSFGKIFACNVDSFIYGQPLFMASLNIAGGTHNVVFVATEKNSVYAFDADGKTCTPLWHTFINLAVPCSTNSPVPGSNCNLVLLTPRVGITSTMFIDPTQGAHGVIYLEARTAPPGVGAFFHELHKLDLTTGKEMPDSPAMIAATVHGNACDNVGGTVTFSSAAQNNRSALLYANGVLYIAFGSINDVPFCPNGAYHGWILGYNAFNIQQQLVVFNTSPNNSTNGGGGGELGAIWGGALAADPSNLIFAVTGNGPFDPTVADWGNSYLKLQPSGSTLKVMDYFAPHQLFNTTTDQDLGASTGIIPGSIAGPHTHVLIGGAKNGTLYLVNRNNMGKFNSTSDQIIQELPGAIGVHLSGSNSCGPNGFNDCDYSTPVYWNGHVYFSGVNDHVKEFTFSSGILTGPVSQSPGAIFGYPGATPTLSANGSTQAILWVVEPATAILHAYDATNLANELYNSNQNAARDALGSNVKFAPVAVVNGRVYVGTRTQIVAYGELP